MKVKVYKSLDRPYSFFGFKGMYIKYISVCFIVDIPLSILMARFIGGIGAVIFFAVALFVAYAALRALQAKYPARERKRWMASWRIPDFISFQPRSFRSYLKYDKDKH